MRLAFLAALLCLATGSLPGYAQDGKISLISLVGKWSATENAPNGTVMSVDLTLGQNMRFSGAASAQGKEVWSYSGTWEVQENQIFWHYEKSSLPLSDLAKSDTDDIVTVDDEKLVLYSHLGGKHRVYLRLK